MDIKSVLKEMVVYGVPVEKTRFSDVDSVVEQIITFMFPSWKSEEDAVRNAVIELMTEGKTPAQLAEMAVRDMSDKIEIQGEVSESLNEHNFNAIEKVENKVSDLSEDISWLKKAIYDLPSEWQYKAWKESLAEGFRKIESVDTKVTILYILTAVIGFMAVVGLLIK